MANGTLVSIEGIDGAGKTTLIEGYENNNGLKDLYGDSVFTSEPNDSSWLGRVVREAIGQDKKHIPPMAVFFLFLSEHANHVDNVVRPSLKNGKLVICDRYIDSRYAYQSYELRDKVDQDTLSWIRDIQEQKWTEIPDLTIIIDVPVEVSMSRCEGDEIFENRDKLEHYRQTYLSIADESSRYRIVDGRNKRYEIVNKCQELIDEVR